MKTKKAKIKKSRFVSLTFKLTLLLLGGCFFALGMITALTIKFSGDDIRVSAENTNWTLNMARANAVHFALPPLTSAALQFFSALKIHHENDVNAAKERFFEEYRDIAAFAVFSGGGSGIFANSHWQAEGAVPAEGGDDSGAVPTEGGDDSGAKTVTVDYEEVAAFLRGSETELRRAAAGENNIYPVPSIAGGRLLVYFCAVKSGAKDPGGVLALFFPRSLIEGCLQSGGGGEGGISHNFSFAINARGELLSAARHFDETAVSGLEITRQALNSALHSLQIRYTVDGKQYLGAYRRLDDFNITVITTVDEDTIDAIILRTTWRNIFAGIAALGLMAVFIALYARRISKPLIALYKASAGIVAGNYTLPLTIKTNDEIGRLARAFVAMRNGIENFEHFTNKPLVNLARAGKLRRKGKLKDAVIMFTFIRDFETLTQDMNADEAVLYINAFLERIVPIIISGGGIIDKYLTQDGLIIMALWGTLQTQGSLEADSAAAVTTALEIRKAVTVWNARYLKEEEIIDNEWRDERIRDRREIQTEPLRFGCSINCGPVVSGQMGCEKRMEHTVIGDAVNLAARVEGAVDIFDVDILITEPVYNLTAGKFAVTPLKPLAAKGVSKPVVIYAVEGGAAINVESAAEISVEAAAEETEGAQ